MKNRLLFGLGTLLVGTTSLAAQQFTLDTSVASSYLASKAGFTVVDAPVVQTYGQATTPVGSFFAWANYRLEQKDVSELDLGWVSPNITTETFGVNAQISGFTYPNSESGFTSWDMEYGVNIFTRQLPFTVNFHAGTNIADENQSGIFQLSANKSFSIGKGTVSVQSAVTYSDKYYSDFSDWSHATIRTEYAHPIGKHLQLYGAITLQKALNSFGGKIHDTFQSAIGIRMK